MIVDFVNGVFEFGGSLMCWMNVRKLLKDKMVMGVYWPAQLFFAAWGWWNMFYYPSLGQWWSFWGGACLVLGNTTWVVLAMKYSKREKT